MAFLGFLFEWLFSMARLVVTRIQSVSRCIAYTVVRGRMVLADHIVHKPYASVWLRWALGGLHLQSPPAPPF